MGQLMWLSWGWIGDPSSMAELMAIWFAVSAYCNPKRALCHNRQWCVVYPLRSIYLLLWTRQSIRSQMQSSLRGPMSRSWDGHSFGHAAPYRTTIMQWFPFPRRTLVKCCRWSIPINIKVFTPAQVWDTLHIPSNECFLMVTMISFYEFGLLGSWVASCIVMSCKITR